MTTITLHDAWTAYSEIETEINHTWDLAVAIEAIFRHRMNDDFDPDGYEAAMRLLVKQLVETGETAATKFRAAAEKVGEADRKERGQA